MSAKQELLATYELWRQWSEAEGEAICRRDWRCVSQCQDAKLGLQAEIIRKTEAAQTELQRAGQDWNQTLTGVRTIINHLMALEMRNSQRIDRLRQESLVEQAENEAAGKNLRRVRRSYGTAQNTGWCSYS